MPTETRAPCECAACGWKGRRLTGKPVTCPKCGEWAVFVYVENKEGE